MSLLHRVNRLVKANLNDLTAQAKDPEKFLNSTLAEMQEDLVKMRQAVDHTTAVIKRTELEYEEANSKANQWHSRAELALKKGNEELARKELEKKVPERKIAEKSKKFLEEKRQELEVFKRTVKQLEGKIAEVKAKINYLKPGKQNIANEPLGNLLNSVKTEPEFDQNPENILETAIQETQKIIEQSILNKENLKKQLIEQETTIKILNQNLINLKRLKGKLTNRSSEVSTLNSDSEINSKLNKLFDVDSNMDDELQQLLQKLIIKYYEIIIEKII